MNKMYVLTSQILLNVLLIFKHVPRVEMRGIHQIATTCMGMSPTNTHMSSSYSNYFSHGGYSDRKTIE